ncbi:AraC family transcriptional regulator [Paenibacillus sp. SN-8-1]|uniref:AraC family transcriptional regulator n=1 Tax=Paenibacillus sp. SN-8-1 TaxID=3435409 RepID=UPI003D9A8695
MLERLNSALAYIEEHLAGEIDMKEAARRACCSEYHFTRMFSFLAGIPLSEYIRRRRLTLSAFDLIHSSMKVIDVAVKYGYSSPDSFARAFQSLHGVRPSEARQQSHFLKSYPPMTFQIVIQGGSEMNYRIVEKEAFRIVGIKRRVPMQFEGVNPEIASMYESLDMETITAIKELSNVEPTGIISSSTNFSEGRMEERGELDHYIGAATTKDCPAHLAQLEVRSGTWAVFESVGPFPATLQNIWGRIYAEWFPSSSYELAEGPEILWNEHKDTSSPTYRSEIWIPVIARDRGTE